MTVTDSVGAYLKGIGRVPLLTAEQEVELATRIEAGAIARGRLDADPDGLGGDERARWERLVADGRRARRHMIEANLRLVVSIARRYVREGGLPLPDLIQEGVIGMMRAVEKFDHRRGLKFSTYATWWIKQALGRALADQSRTIRVPAHMAELINRVNRTRRDLLWDLGEEPTPARIAVELGLTPEKVEQALRYDREPVSLHAPIGGDGAQLGDFLADDAADPAAEVAASSLRSYLDTVLAALTEREATVIAQRFGLADEQPRTLDEIGRALGLTRERIRQIETKAMTKLRHPTRTRVLADLLA
ncbi:sigma-70 family RNA polymerase sigma factor [Micromonospora sp. URMC 106]|uniref:sigma-70 family RNA polymerase sigma factor n=1 Tax=Micromonospora sp. URMC 106 TaxID=3423408 RepID=UPI003F19AC37